MDKKVAVYLKRQNKEQKGIIEALRIIIINNLPKLIETVMTEGLWYEGKFYITSFKNHVNLGIGISGLTEDEINPFEGKGKSMRHIKLYSVEDINKNELLKVMKMVDAKVNCKCNINWKN
jgi:hypothetical protein